MPEKSLTVATYAAGASLAAITLIYVFGPTYFLDESPSGPSGIAALSNRKKGVVGLSNPANDCFINSVLQALAGLGDLRLYLIREMHRRNLDEGWVYAQAIPREARGSVGHGQRDMPDWKVEGLQSGSVTKALKDILDSLNERPIYRKTITAAPFVRSLELAFRQRISRQQQDAQEFLQVVAERLCDEYHAGRRARSYARGAAALPNPDAVAEQLGSGMVGHKLATLALDDTTEDDSSGPAASPPLTIQRTPPPMGGQENDDEEEGFPMEGKFESQIECLTCQFKPRPTESTFCTLTLNVPQTSSTTLNACFDGMFKTEYIDDFKCEKCRLTSPSESFREKATTAIAKLQAAIETNPEKPPEDVVLPDLRYAPKRRIARHIRLTRFPKIMAVHLSRSIYDASHLSQKNSAKVAFPERLPLGGLLHQRKYKLLALVTHKGSHHSGHYESFRRQNFYPPFSNPGTFQPSDVYSRSASPAPTPRIGALQPRPDGSNPSASAPDLLSPPSVIASSSTPSLESTGPAASSTSQDYYPSPSPSSNSEAPPPTSVAASARSTLSRIASSLPSSRSGSRNGSGRDTPNPNSNNNNNNHLSPAVAGSEPAARDAGLIPASAAARAVAARPATGGGGGGAMGKAKRRKHSDRWWRISDEKIKEASTREVLSMRREVYLLFYELEREGPP
ncbi:cysteine proteinase [Phialemonium atrogriseum]|uniref:Ubiquitin carboxyl-terminal hydrolase n=1 Tax=Phialemonium atrogriseum TaxID=1093897 RepID=A0AAJ0BWT2_9PEZI|nr:cysteine proteinase [Phialemonium atrogriseum]KAK1764554.1 cysteine proteinase [Phialemonium atrogriseum]